MPAGTYDVTLKDGTLDIGSGLLPPIPLQSGTSFSLDLGSQPLSAPIGLTILSAPINQSGTGYSFTGTVDVTVAGAGATIDPATGDATVDASFYATLNGSGNVTVANISFPVSGSCSLGSAQQPVNLHLTTAQGSAWDPGTGAMSLADHAFALTYSCDPALFQTLIDLIAGATDAGNNVATIVGTAIRRPDVVTTPTTTTSQPGAGGGSTTPTDGNPNEVTPVTTPTAKACVVPKLVGKTLKQAKRALQKAGCKAGKAKKKTSKKRKKGRIVKQRYKAGTKLPAGAKVPLTISKGPQKARKHRSR
jgi:PASTA domain